MNLVHCEKCGGLTAEGFSLCPECMRQGGAGDELASVAAEILDIATIANMGDTDISQRSAIESILRIKNRMEDQDREEKT